MRKVIDSINEGQINRKFGTLSFSVSKIEHTVNLGAVCEGSFSVVANTHNLTEGYVISDDYRMECISSYFSGAQDEIAYRFHSNNLAPGQDIKGNINIISNRGEYQIPFVIHIEADVLETSVGPVRNIFHFTNLAKSNWDEALKLFYDSRFVNVFTGADREYLSTYKALSGVQNSQYNMDEFLVTIRKKTPVEFIPSEKQIEINDPMGMRRFSLNISRNGWGYTQASVLTEGSFLSVDTTKINLDTFLGNNLALYYYIDSDSLHPGKNLGAIIIKDERHETKIPVLVNSNRDGKHFQNMTLTRMKGIIKIMELYQAMRLKKISGRTWMNDCQQIIEDMLVNDPEDLIFRLYQIHMMATQERNNEAAWNLRTVRMQAESIKDEKPYLWCYYLYISSLVDDDENKIEAYESEVNRCFKLDPDNWRIAWLMSYMADEYTSVSRKWAMYERLFYAGCYSPVILLESARIVLDNPCTITKLERFELQVLRYIIKKGMLNEDVVFAIRTLAEHYKDYSDSILVLLEQCYRDYPHDELLLVICSKLIKGDRTDSKAFLWYGYAVKQELKITRLYEYYMMSMDKSQREPIPRQVLMYFSFHSDLDYETNAYLYATVVKNKLNDSQMYSRYLPQIENFVVEQLAAGHNNTDLAVIYKNLLNDNMLLDEVTAARVADIIFMYELDLRDYPDIRKVILCYEHRDGEEVYPVTRGKAVFPIYSGNYCIAIEDENQNRSVGTKEISPVQLMSTGRLLLNLQLMLKKHIGIDVHCCMEHQMSADIRPENEFRFRNLFDADYFSLEYSRSVAMKLVRFYFDQERYEELDLFLEKLNNEYVAEYERAECVRYMVKRGLYDKAIKWIYMYGPEGIDSTTICDLIRGWLPVHRNSSENYMSLLTQLLMSTLDSPKNNLVNIQYLIAHLRGNSKDLRNLWNKAKEFEVNRQELEENLIIQLLYTGAYLPEKGEIIEDYAYHIPDDEVLKAALNSSCFDYFVDDILISEHIFNVITDAFESDLELDTVCDLAYVKFFAENKDKIDDKVRPALKNALHRLLGHGVVMECFRNLSDFMPSMSPYADATIIEYRTSGGSQVNIHYIIETDEDDEYHSEMMQEVYCGVYSFSFTLFFGEKLMYYITEGNDEENDTLSVSNSIMKSDTGDTVSKGRFGLINDICIGKTLRDYATVDELLEEYYRKDFLSNMLFDMYKG